MRLPHALKSTHWVVWSSPVLLLVLVFTWTASSSSTPAHHLETLSVTPPTHSTSRSHSPPTTIPVTTTTSAVEQVKTRTTPRETSPTTPPIAAEPPTSVVHVKRSSSATGSNDRSNANASVANASSGVVSGQLSPAFDVADVPLQGPGTWEVATSAPASVTLSCDGTAVTVNQQMVIAAHTTCQVTIAPSAPNHHETWELTPIS